MLGFNKVKISGTTPKLMERILEHPLLFDGVCYVYQEF